MKREEILRFLEEKKPELEEKFGVRRIGLFGSYAKDEGNKDSDIDLVVELEKPDLLCLVGIKQMVESELNIKVDIVRYRDSMNKFLKKRIDRDARYA